MRLSVIPATATGSRFSLCHRAESETLRRKATTVINVISAPIGDVVASLLPKPPLTPLWPADKHAWSYINCVGTEFGNHFV